VRSLFRARGWENSVADFFAVARGLKIKLV
jgi:hypothetical protein